MRRIKLNLKLISLFVGRRKNINNSNIRSSYASIASIIGIISNFILFIIKLIIGLISGSMAIIADAVNNISDAASSIITLVGFKLSEKPADKEHPYGHKRMEYLSGLIVSILICFLGFEFLTSSISSIFNPTETKYTPALFIILIISIIIKLWQSFFYLSVGKHIESSTLLAASVDSRNDVISTLAVLIGAIISTIMDINLDGYLALAVAILILKSGVSLIIETSNPLLGTAPSTDLVKSIGSHIMTYDGVLGFHDLVVHSYGHDKIFASVHIEVPAEQDILLSHDIIDNIELDFRNNMNIHLVVHLDPVITSDEELSELKRCVEAVIMLVGDKTDIPLSMHDFRAVKGATHTNLIFDLVIPFECKFADIQITDMVDAEIKKLHGDYNTVILCDRCYVDKT